MLLPPDGKLATQYRVPDIEHLMKRSDTNMEERKYGKYFVTECTKPRPEVMGSRGIRVV